VSLFGKGRVDSSTTRLYFATDIHGSDVCFRKFLNAGQFYQAQYLILGGDITGKSLIPIEHRGGTWNAKYLDHEYAAMGEIERRQLEQYIRQNGQYPVIGDRDELLALRDEKQLEALFRKVVVDGILAWVDLAEHRLHGTGIRCFITPGNDDFWEVDEALKGSQVVEFVEGKCIRLDEHHEMITTGYSNVTPWRSPRELGETELGARIAEMYRMVEDPGNLIAVLHVPPKDTKLDQAPSIDENLNLQLDSGGTVMTGVGSTAVRLFIEQCQPLLGLHGHVHDSKGEVKIGRTLCLNPGSEYTDGTLRGAIVTLDANGVRSHQLVVG